MTTVITIPVKSLSEARNLSILLDGSYVSKTSKKGVEHTLSCSRVERRTILNSDRSNISHLVLVPYDEDLLNIKVDDKVIMVASSIWSCGIPEPMNPLSTFGVVTGINNREGTFQVLWGRGLSNGAYRPGRDIIKVE